MKIQTLRQIRKCALRFDPVTNDVERIDARGPTVWPNEPGEHFHRCRLARSIRADQKRDRASARQDRHVAQDRLTTVIFYEMFGGDHRWDTVAFAARCAR